MNWPAAPTASVRGWSLSTLAVLAIFYTLYFASELLLPLILALLFAVLLSPIVLALGRWGVPRPLAAFLLVFSLTGVLVVGVSLLANPAADWLYKAPEVAAELQRKISPLRRAVEQVSQAAQEVEQMASVDKQGDVATEVELKGPSLRDWALQRARVLLLSTTMVVFLLYFLLATGDRLLRNTLHALPSWSTKRRLVVVARHLQREVSRYLLTFTIINIVLGLLVTLLTWSFGIPNPLLWGTLAGLLNFVPYLGPAVTLVILAAISVLSLPDPGQAALVPLIFFILTSLEGQLITPTILGRQLSLNPIFIFAGLIFWGWLWGIVGALLAVPIMVSLKIVCDHLRPLRPIGVIMGR